MEAKTEGTGIRRDGMRATARRVTLSLLAILAVASLAFAGPPFFTDDPITMARHGWEAIFSLQAFDGRALSTGAMPQLELNYGLTPRLTLHAIFVRSYARLDSRRTDYGMGDVELGVLFRLATETRSRPRLGFFPHLEVPTGSRTRGLGNGGAQVLLPLWALKTFGDKWRVYGGGGYWINSGRGNRDFWTSGITLERDLSDALTVGAEVLHNTSSAVDVASETGFTVGALLQAGKGQIVASIGRDFKGPNRLLLFVGYDLAWGERGRAYRPAGFRRPARGA